MGNGFRRRDRQFQTTRLVGAYQMSGISSNERHAAYHEAAHAVACAVLGLPLQDLGMHIDRGGMGVTFNLHRKPGKPSRASDDFDCCERSIVMIKAGYKANLKLDPLAPPHFAENDRLEEEALLNEMYPHDGQALSRADEKLSAASHLLVARHWNAIESLAGALLEKPRTPQTIELKMRKEWKSADMQERCLRGNEIAAILKALNLDTIVQR